MRSWLPVLLLLLMWGAAAREDYPGQFSQIDPYIREWFNTQKAPGSGKLCCSVADGTPSVQEDIRRNSSTGEREYWVRFRTRDGIDVDWQRVPPDTVLTTPNVMLVPVVWYYFDDGEKTYRVRCFAPGVQG